MADVSKIEYQITATDQATAVFKSLSRSMQDATGSVTKLQAALGALAGAAGLTAFAAFMDKLISSAAALDKMSVATGAAVENLSKFSSIAKIGGNDMGAVEVALTKLAKGMTAADEETKGAGHALAFLGISAKDSRGNLKDTGDIMTEVAKKLDLYADGAGKTAIAQDLFGKSGAAILPFLRDLAALSEIAAKVTTKQAAQAEEYEKALKRLSLISQSYFRQLALEAVPTMTAFVTALLEAKNSGDKIGETVKKLKDDNSVASWAEEAGRFVASLVDGFRRLAAMIEIVGRGLAAMSVDAVSYGSQKINETAKYLGLPYSNVAIAQGKQRERTGGAMAEFYADRARIIEDIDKNSFSDRFEGMLAKTKALGAGGKKDPLNYNRVNEKAGGADKAMTLDELLAKGALKQLQVAEAAQHAGEAAGEKAYEATRLAAQKAEEELNKLADHWKLVADPIEKYRRQLEEIQKLEEAGKLTHDQASEALFKVNDDIEKAMGNTIEKTKEADDWMRKLGLTFSSAFEDAIVGGKGFGDVLKGLEKDIARIIARKTITEPLGKAISDSFGSSSSGGFLGDIGGWFKKTLGFAGGGDFTVGGGGGTDSQLVAFRATPGEEVSVRRPGQGGGDTYIIDARGADAAGMARLESMILSVNGSIERRSVAAVAERHRFSGRRPAFS